MWFVICLILVRNLGATRKKIPETKAGYPFSLLEEAVQFLPENN
jgi:hypothetical protein